MADHVHSNTKFEGQGHLLWTPVQVPSQGPHWLANCSPLTQGLKLSLLVCSPFTSHIEGTNPLPDELNKLIYF
jgi:hypothetical protein